MWIFCEHGLLSMVCARDARGNTDKSRFVVRARRRSHLDAVRKLLPELGDVVVGGSDYPFRCICDRATAAELLQRLTDEIDYDNFKDRATDAERVRELGAFDGYARFLMETWSRGLSLEPEEDE